MNNFRKCCVFYNHISLWAPATRWRGGGRGGSRRSPQSPSWKHKITISIWGTFSPSYGGLFLHMKDLFSPFGGHCFSLCTVLEFFFLHVRDYFSPYVESFSGMSSLTKIAASAHAFAARVVASVAPSGNLREIARLNL